MRRAWSLWKTLVISKERSVVGLALLKAECECAGAQPGGRRALADAHVVEGVRRGGAADEQRERDVVPRARRREEHGDIVQLPARASESLQFPPIQVYLSPRAQ